MKRLNNRPKPKNEFSAMLNTDLCEMFKVKLDYYVGEMITRADADELSQELADEVVNMLTNDVEVLVTMPEKPYYQNDVSYIKVNGEWYGAESARQKLGIDNIRNLSTGDKVNGHFIDGTKQINRETKDNFQSSHFDEPNILVHLRMNTRTDAEGNKVLFLEEVQSDWGQKGKNGIGRSEPTGRWKAD